MNDKEIIEMAISAYGKDAQVLMAIEEMSELTKALCKERRVRDNDDPCTRQKILDNIAEEIADVQIMLNQLRMIFRLNTESIESDKIKRLEDRLKGYKRCPICGATDDCFCEEFDAYVPVTSEGDIVERSVKPGEEWVFHAKYCPNCGRKL